MIILNLKKNMRKWAVLNPTTYSKQVKLAIMKCKNVHASKQISLPENSDTIREARFWYCNAEFDTKKK